jgi:hypothetical protein
MDGISNVQNSLHDLKERDKRLQSRDNRRLWENCTGPRPDRCVPAGQQIDGFKGLCGRRPED